MEEWRRSLGPRIAEARAQLLERDPVELASLSGAEYLNGELQLRLFEKAYRITYPDLVAYGLASNEPVPEELQALLLDYLRRADGTLQSGEWLAFRELPHGQFYHRAFQGYSGDSLAQAFGNDLAGFQKAGGELGERQLGFGDAAFAFQVLPHLWMAVVYWQGDEEFPSKASVLFDAAAGRYLPTDGLAILGRWLCSKLVKLRQERRTQF